MHISITDDLKKQFHAACAFKGLKMSRVVSELIEQWLKTNQKNACGVNLNQSVTKSNQPTK